LSTSFPVLGLDRRSGFGRRWPRAAWPLSWVDTRI